MTLGAALPDWARWNPAVAEAPWTVGIEEEVMLLEPVSGAPAWRSEDVLVRLGPELAGHVRAETHACALELGTDPHPTVPSAVAELGALRSRLSRAVRATGLGVAVAGTHPLVRSEDSQVSTGARYRELHDSLRSLARREPTFALHVHVAVPDARLAIRALDAMRVHLPMLLALSANSPFLRGRDSGFASARTPVFQEFPRAGLPRAFGDYRSYVEAIDVLVRTRAIPESTFVWWDARLQPSLGTLEVRVMDAQTRLVDTAALAALVQCLVRLEAMEGFAESELVTAHEALEENRFLAARDGIGAEFVDPREERRVPATERLSALLEACRPHAEELGCTRELERVGALAADPGPARQRAAARKPNGLPGLMRTLQAEFAPGRDEVRRGRGIVVSVPL
jgi:glutamate---cysteine ligase / carboxylate-amine ligase